MKSLLSSCEGLRQGLGSSRRHATDSLSESGTESSESRSSVSSFDSLAGESSWLRWPMGKTRPRVLSIDNGDEDEKHMTHLDDSRSQKTELDVMKERMARLLLGEDMSGTGKGVCTALAISNAITNLYATVFGQLWRLEPLSSEKKSMWEREMELLLCVSDHIVELVPSSQTFPDGTKIEVMTGRPRSDLFIGLPALLKLDNLLVGTLESFRERDFWYVDRGVITNGSESFREDKWWLPVPRVPIVGLSENSRKKLNHTRECTVQILKAAMEINRFALSEMEVPQAYLDALPRSGKNCLGDLIYKCLTSNRFSAQCLLDCIGMSSEHAALDIVNRVEASIQIWLRRSHSKPIPLQSHGSSARLSSWEMVKELIVDDEKRHFLVRRAESLLFCLKQRFPGLPQTALDTSKILFNKDVGKSILESYSRVVEGLAYNLVARIDDVLNVDALTKRSGGMPSFRKAGATGGIPNVSVISNSPYCTRVFSTPASSPERGERAPFLSSRKKIEKSRRFDVGFGVKRVLANYLGVESRTKLRGDPTR